MVSFVPVAIFVLNVVQRRRLTTTDFIGILHLIFVFVVVVAFFFLMKI